MSEWNEHRDALEDLAGRLDISFAGRTQRDAARAALGRIAQLEAKVAEQVEIIHELVMDSDRAEKFEEQAKARAAQLEAELQNDRGLRVGYRETLEAVALALKLDIERTTDRDAILSSIAALEAELTQVHEDLDVASVKTGRLEAELQQAREMIEKLDRWLLDREDALVRAERAEAELQQVRAMLDEATVMLKTMASRLGGSYTVKDFLKRVAALRDAPGETP